MARWFLIQSIKLLEIKYEGYVSIKDQIGDVLSPHQLISGNRRKIPGTVHAVESFMVTLLESQWKDPAHTHSRSNDRSLPKNKAYDLD